MAFLFWDASALVKRYFSEVGSSTVDELFKLTPSANMSSTPWGYAEVYSILLRRYNSGAIDAVSFSDASRLLKSDVMDDPDFGLLSITDADVFNSLTIMRRHHLNATDAAILTVSLRILPSPPPSDFALITSDHRLLRSAIAEGINALDPSTLLYSDVPSYLATLV